MLVRSTGSAGVGRTWRPSFPRCRRSEAGVTAVVERCELGAGLGISRVVNGLWQIADMGRGGRTLDPGAAAPAMGPSAQARSTTLDIAPHDGSAPTNPRPPT